MRGAGMAQPTAGHLCAEAIHHRTWLIPLYLGPGLQFTCCRFTLVDWLLILREDNRLMSQQYYTKQLNLCENVIMCFYSYT